MSCSLRISSMELDASAAIDANDAAVDTLHDEVPVADTPVTEDAGDNSNVGDEEVGKTENDPEMTTGDHPLDDSIKAPKQPVGDQEIEQNEALPTETEEAADADTTHVDDVEMAELLPDPSAVSDPGNAPEEAGTGNDSDEKDEALEVSVVETPATEQGGASEADNLPVPSPTDNSSTSTEAEAITDEQGTGNVEIAQASDTASPLPHDESEYDPSTPALMTVVPHGEDEYDPANPSPAGTPVGSNTTTGFANHHEQDEYDPDHPSMTAPAAAEEPTPMEVEHTSPSTTENEQPTVTPVKRKAEDVPNASSVAQTNGDSNPKRPRHVDDSKSSRLDEDNKQGRHRRGSGDSTSSTSSKQKQHEDHKGLSAAAWDRLMDFQTSGEFRVTQVSRAAFSSVGAMPEFAQIAIIARFVRTPMKDVRDKNGQLMRIYREYQKENPQVAAVQPVDAFISDYKSDPGLFRFGYAPPLPATGMSNVQVPYIRDQPKEDKNSPRPTRSTARNEPERHQQKDVDEFGRSVHLDKSIAPETNGSTRSANQRAAVDPRLAARSRQGPPSPTTQAVPRTTTGARAEDPRRRDQPLPQSSSGAGRDPRRRGSATNQQSSPRDQSGAPRAAGSNDLFERLPGPVKAVVDSMRREGRLQEPLNDNVVTRLLHLPERVALQAVENFSNVDLAQVENLQGFLVGIINRVNEKAIASEKQQRPQVPSPRGQPPSTMSRGGGYAAPQQGGSVLGGPPPAGRLSSNNGATGGGYRGQAGGPGPALYDRPFEAPPDPRDPRRRQPAPQGPQYGGPVRGPSPVGAGRAPIGIQSFTALPLSVQNHVHSLVANHTLSSLEELGGKCYEVLGQLSEPLANQVLSRFAGANLSNVRNKSGFLIGVVKRARQEYGFN